MANLSNLPPIRELIVEALSTVEVAGKLGKAVLQPLIGRRVEEAGYLVDLEDRRGFLPANLPVWRDRTAGTIEQTTRRRLIDLVIYSPIGAPVALIETESDLDDLRLNGTSSRRGHYDVHSIALDGRGQPFNSYKSLERMGAAAYYHAYPGLGEAAVARLQTLVSDVQADHNPAGLQLLLVVGRCRPSDRSILAPRLNSLGAQLLSVADAHLLRS
jgi:hypothetical protein